MPIVELEGIDITYTVKRHPRRRYIRLEVWPGHVIVRVPQRFANRQIPGIIGRQAGWIHRQLAELDKVRAETSRKYVSGERFPYLGKAYKLNVDYSEDTTNSSVKMTEGHLSVVTTRPYLDGVDEEGRSDVRDLILSWYRGRAKEYLPARLD